MPIDLPVDGSTGWGGEVRAAIARINAHDANPLVTATASATGAAVGQVPTVTQLSPLTFSLANPGSAAIVYVDPAGDDARSGRSWAAAKGTIGAALAALGSDGGTVELGAGTFTVSSSGRMDTCTFTASSSTIADASITSGDVGSYVISPYLRSPLVIASVTPGVSFTVTDPSGFAVTPESSGSSLSIITKPAVVVPPGVRLRGQGCSWSADWDAQRGVLNHAGTWITDAGTGVTILCGHPRDTGPVNSGQQATGTWLERFATKGNANNLFGIAQINNWSVVGEKIDSVGNGMGGLLVAANANATRFTDCRFGANGSASSTTVTGGVVVLENVPKIPFGPVKFDTCFFTANYGWGVVGTADFATPKGARAVRLSYGMFNNVRVSTLAGSGTHVAISGDECRSLLDDCIFESGAFLNLDVYDAAPVTAISCKFLATGGTQGTLPYMVRLNTNALFEAIGCGFLSATSYHVQVGTGATFNWRSCVSTGGSFTFAADPSGLALATQPSAGLPAGSTASPVEPLNGIAGSARSNETCPRLIVNSAALAVVNQELNLTYLTATKTATISQVALEVGSTASGGAATYVGVGVYVVNGDSSLTLLASTPVGNANAFQAANTSVTLALASSTNVAAGKRYAIGLLMNSPNALPTFRGVQTYSRALNSNPPLTSAVTGQTSLPSSIAAGGNGGSFFAARLL